MHTFSLLTLREKSSQSKQIYFAALRDEKNRRFIPRFDKEIK